MQSAKYLTGYYILPLLRKFRPQNLKFTWEMCGWLHYTSDYSRQQTIITNWFFPFKLDYRVSVANQRSNILITRTIDLIWHINADIRATISNLEGCEDSSFVSLTVRRGIHCIIHISEKGITDWTNTSDIPRQSPCSHASYKSNSWLLILEIFPLNFWKFLLSST